MKDQYLDMQVYINQLKTDVKVNMKGKSQRRNNN